jgi:hypothetical protein
MSSNSLNFTKSQTQRSCFFTNYPFVGFLPPFPFFSPFCLNPLSVFSFYLLLPAPGYPSLDLQSTFLSRSRFSVYCFLHDSDRSYTCIFPARITLSGTIYSCSYAFPYNFGGAQLHITCLQNTTQNYQLLPKLSFFQHTCYSQFIPKLSFFQHSCHLSYNIPIISQMLNAHSYLSLCSSRPLPYSNHHLSYLIPMCPCYLVALLDPGSPAFWPYLSPYLSPYLERVFHCPLPRSFRSLCLLGPC